MTTTEKDTLTASAAPALDRAIAAIREEARSNAQRREQDRRRVRYLTSAAGREEAWRRLRA